MMKTRQLSISIRLNAQRAYERLRRPQSFPKWASGLAGSLKKTRGGFKIYIPLRVIANGDGCELTLMLLRHDLAAAKKLLEAP